MILQMESFFIILLTCLSYLLNQGVELVGTTVIYHWIAPNVVAMQCKDLALNVMDSVKATGRAIVQL